MATFDRPTINDFLAQLQAQSDRALRHFQARKNEIDTEAMKSGTRHGSRHAILTVDAIEEHVEIGVAVLLGELRRAIGYPELDPTELRNLIAPRLQEYAQKVISASGIPNLLLQLRNASFTSHINERLDKIPHNIGFWLRQFDIGWDSSVQPEILTRPPPAS